MANSVVIVAGGSGTRFGSAIPKQFLNLVGKPVIMHTIEVFYHFDSQLEIIVVLPKDQFEHWNSLCREHNFTIHHTVIEGGEQRFHSVKNGLLACRNTGVVGIHDAVRPLVSVDTLKRCYETAETKGVAIPVVLPVDSIRVVKGDVNSQVSRDDYRLIQTPQCFRKELIIAAFDQDYKTGFTDDASVLESFGKEIFLVEGNRENIKITTPIDLKIATALLS